MSRLQYLNWPSRCNLLQLEGKILFDKPEDSSRGGNFKLLQNWWWLPSTNSALGCRCPEAASWFRAWNGYSKCGCRGPFAVQKFLSSLVFTVWRNIYIYIFIYLFSIPDSDLSEVDPTIEIWTLVLPLPAGIGKVASVFLTCGGERICRSASVGPRFFAGLSMDSSQIAFFFGQCASWRCGWWTDNEWHFEVWWRIRDIGRLRRRSGFLSWPWNFFWHGWSRWAGFG